MDSSTTNSPAEEAAAAEDATKNIAADDVEQVAEALSSENPEEDVKTEGASTEEKEAGEISISSSDKPQPPEEQPAAAAAAADTISQDDRHDENHDHDNHNRYQHFKLYGFWKSSSTWRVRIALAAKAVEYTTVPIHVFHGEQNASWYIDTINALGQVPVLEFVDTQDKSKNRIIRLSQSIAIIEFLEGAFPDRPSLYPKNNLLQKAFAYQLIEIINSGIQPLQNLPYLNRIEYASQQSVLADDLARDVIEKGLRGLERLVVAHQLEQLGSEGVDIGPYCLGTKTPSVVEAFLIPQMANAKGLLSKVKLNATCPTLVRIDALCDHHPWFQQSHPKEQPDAGT